MKKLLLCALLLVTSMPAVEVRAQTDAADAEIARLKEEVQRREAVERSPTILPGDKQVNHGLLEGARARLRAALQSRVAAKQELRATLGDSMTAEEKDSLARSLASLESDLRALDQAPPPSIPTNGDERLAGAPALSTPLPPGGGQSPSSTDSTAAPIQPPPNPAGPATVTGGQQPTPAGGAPDRTLFTAATASDKTDALPIRSCADVGAALQQSPNAASTFEKFFCAAVTRIKRAKVASPNTPLAGLDLRRDNFFFMIALLAKEGRAQYVLAFEDERVDKQVGSDASSSGSTSLVSKGSVPTIFGFAVDAGALTQSSSGSTVTFRGNLAGLAKAAAGKGFISGYDEDSPGARLLRKVSFALSYDPTRGAEPGVFTGRKQQLSNYSVHFDLYNKRDPRDNRYQRDWKNFLANESNALVTQIGLSFAHMTRQITTPTTTAVEWVDPALQSWFAAADRAMRDASADDVESVFREQLNKVPTNLSGETQGELRAFEVRFRDWLQGREMILAKIAKAPIVSFDYLNDRPANSPTLSKFKFIAETGLQRWLDLTFNGSATVFDSRPAAPSTSRLRDFQFALQLDAQMGEIGMGLGKPVLSFAGRFERLASDVANSAGATVMNTKGDIGVGQLKLTIPIKNSGVRIPISLSFANRTELIKEKEVRGNFGFTFDLDTLFAKFKPFTQH